MADRPADTADCERGALDRAVETIQQWLAARRVDDVTRDVERLAPLAAMDCIVDGANSVQPDRRQAGLRACFAGVVEALNDSFRPEARLLYGRLFARAIWRCAERDQPLMDRLLAHRVESEASLFARWQRVRCVRPVDQRPERIVVLSRVTVGADVLLSSVLLQRLHQRWPEAELILVGDAKLAGLFGGFPRVRVEALRYARRGSLAERFGSWHELAELLGRVGADLICSPDSRLDQLGLLPLIDVSRYRLWENTQPDAPRPLVDLLNDWCDATLGAARACHARLSFPPAFEQLAQRFSRAFGPATTLLAVKLDHGGNPAKALPREAECRILQGARALGWRVVIDRGFGDEELAASQALVDDLGWDVVDVDESDKQLGLAVETLTPGQLEGAAVIRFHGSIAGWAACLRACGCALSYDSVGHHLAAACGLTTITAFTGYEDESFPIAWRPSGSGTLVTIEIPMDEKANRQHADRVLGALTRAWEARS